MHRKIVGGTIFVGAVHKLCNTQRGGRWLAFALRQGMRDVASTNYGGDKGGLGDTELKTSPIKLKH